MEYSGFWKEFNTDWACLDCELMPWSEKAQELLKSQYAAVGSAATASLSECAKLLRMTSNRHDIDKDFELPEESSARHLDIEALLDKIECRRDAVSQYIAAYRQYCWPVHSINDLKLAPFHLLATEGKVHVDHDHEWHMKIIARISHEISDIVLATDYKIIDVTEEGGINEGIQWWEGLTAKGGEGMVIKPLSYIARGKKGLVQPALKCRGREYLRIIYGAEYTEGDNLERLRTRALGTKRSLALREFSLGVESLERFVRKEPLRRIHECVFGVLALESEPVDPRL
jgi:protein phosphatase